MIRNNKFVRIAGFTLLTGATIIGQSSVASAHGTNDTDDKASKGSVDTKQLKSQWDALEKQYKDKERERILAGNESKNWKSWENNRNWDKDRDRDRDKNKRDTRVVVRDIVRVESKDISAATTQTPQIVGIPTIEIKETPKTVVAAPKPAPVATVQGAQLAKTGAETPYLVGLGAALLGVGIAMDRAAKRARRSSEGDGIASASSAMAAATPVVAAVAAGSPPAHSFLGGSVLSMLSFQSVNNLA